jgi:trehalose/maltose hydrolase-like predicted phosphorylase
MAREGIDVLVETARMWADQADVVLALFLQGEHVANAAGVWRALVHGFARMRDYRGITFDPRLPESWSSLTFRADGA